MRIWQSESPDRVPGRAYWLATDIRKKLKKTKVVLKPLYLRSGEYGLKSQEEQDKVGREAHSCQRWHRRYEP